MKIPVLLCVLALSSCGLGTEINAGPYDQSCAQDIDCVPVFQGNTCDACNCPNTAVNKAQSARYQMDLVNRRAQCGALPLVECGPCPPTRGVCASSRCSSRPE